jgi:hypothetical protein
MGVACVPGNLPGGYGNVLVYNSLVYNSHSTKSLLACESNSNINAVGWPVDQGLPQLAEKTSLGVQEQISLNYVRRLTPAPESIRSGVERR